MMNNIYNYLWIIIQIYKIKQLNLYVVYIFIQLLKDNTN